MKYTIVALAFLGVLVANKSISQNLSIDIDSRTSELLQRLDIRLSNDSLLRFSTWKPYDQRHAIAVLKRLDSLSASGVLPELTAADRFEIKQSIALYDKSQNIAESQPGEQPFHLLKSQNEKFTLQADPLLNLEGGRSSDKENLYHLSVGANVYGSLGKKIMYQFSYAYNRERIPAFARSYFIARQGLQGAQTFRIKGAWQDQFEYNDFRGNISWQATKHIDVKAGYDQFFIGEGIRTTYLSNFSAPFYFLQLHAGVGRLNYTTVIARTIAPYGSVDNGLKDQTAPGNLLVFHYASFQAAKWLKIGFFENNTYNNEINGGFQPGMLNPFIFNRGMSQQVGNSGKSSIGLDFKVNLWRHVQLYNQILINEFLIDHVLDYSSKSSWRNKHAIQLGAKYADAFGIKNLDLQAEYNAVRPFTYTDKWVANNFTHDNLPLAHPMGANFREYIGRINYQPMPRLRLTALIMSAKKGLDTLNNYTAVNAQNWGGDLFRNYLDGNTKQDVAIGDGVLAKTLYGSLEASYQVFPGGFIDAGFTFRKYNLSVLPTEKVNYFNIGIRWNLSKRRFFF